MKTLVFALCLLLVSCGTSGRSNAQSVGQPIILGATTHFAQGWPLSLINNANNIGATALRDSISWRKVEIQPGNYVFTDANSGYVDKACKAGNTIILGILPQNPLYDGGQTAYSPEGQLAFSRYILAIANRFKGCVTGVEVGNEINGKNGMTGPAAANRPRYYTALLKSVYTTVKPQHPEFAVLGGSTISVAVGFLNQLFQAGALNYMDGVVVHPYRPEPESVDWEIHRLNDAMAQAGAIKPIWATEFSKDFKNPNDAPAYLVKMVALMSGSGVKAAYWYALVDQSFFPTMGLLTKSGGPKPASQSFSNVQSDLLSRGKGVRIDEGDASVYHFTFGPDRHVIWGTPRALSVSGRATFMAADGSVMSAPQQLGDAPIIVEGKTSISFGPAEVLADSRSGFAQSPFSYFARRVNKQIVPLTPIDWQYDSYIGNASITNLEITPYGMSLLGSVSEPVQNIIRYTATQSTNAWALVCIIPNSGALSGASFTLQKNGVTVIRQNIASVHGETDIVEPVAISIGDQLDFEFGPDQTSLGGHILYRIRVARSKVDLPSCPK